MLKLVLVVLSIFCCADWSVSFERFDTVSTEEMQQLLEKRKNGSADFILVNALDRIIFREHSIPGSINIPLSDIDTQLAKLGKDKEKLIITYCMGFR